MLHVCASAALYRPLEMNIIESTNSVITQTKSPDQTGVTRSIASGCLNTNTNTTYIGSTDEPMNKKYIEHLFLEESKNRINDYYNTNKFGTICRYISLYIDGHIKFLIYFFSCYSSSE